MKQDHFKNKVCWITGASSGIGAALALTLNRLGATVIVSSRNTHRLGALRNNCDYPDHVLVLPCDMEGGASLGQVAREAWRLHDGIDYVFLNAGMAVRDLVENTELVMIQKVMNVNFISNTVIIRALLPMMIKRRRGHFIVTSSLSGRFGVPKLSAYSASKHAMNGFMESLRAEYETKGVRATIATVGLVKTNIALNALMGDGTRSGKDQESIARGITPEQCARDMVQAVAANRREVFVGGIEGCSVFVKRFFPGLHASLIGKNPMRRMRNIIQRMKRYLFFPLAPAPASITRHDVRLADNSRRDSTQ